MNKIIYIKPYLKKKNIDELLKNKKVSFIFSNLQYVVRNGVGQWINKK